jgi:hypothetical protein
VITIVSGLPRSGTSLMMQMLAAGGMPILTDGERTPDADNPRGYCEWEPAKLLPKDPPLIEQAEGKAVKVISQLLFALPTSRQYQILFMRRPLAEVVASQAEMIRRRNQAAPVLPASQMISALQGHLNQVKSWLKDRQNISLRDVEYHDLLGDPRRICTLLREFLSSNLDIEAMARQLDPALYRQRIPQAVVNK